MKARIGRFLFLVAFLGCATTTATTAPAVVGRPLKLAVNKLDGDPVELGNQHGKVLLLDLWATWCEPCKQALPYFQQLSKDFGAKGLTVYAISCDEKKDAVAPFMKNIGVSLPVLWDKGGDTTSAALGVIRLPTTFLVDRTGTIRFAHEGFTDEIAAQEKQQIQVLLAEQ
jgi:cytochrome c biogenesis protein CcmG, thiol:disulfide interchange protein DsbE